MAAAPADPPFTLGDDPRRWPADLVGLYRSTSVGERVRIEVPASTPPTRVRDVLEGAGFRPGRRRLPPAAVGTAFATLSATRLRTLPDLVRPKLRLLLCGLNPSIYSADVGRGFARPGNRFWPALAAAGIDVDGDPLALLAQHAIGMTDVVKRATVAAAELTADEYRSGLARVGRLCGWLQPEAVCFVGLAGWRAAVDRRAGAGWQPHGLGGVAAYVMPSTSGLNAATSLAALTEHLRIALAGRVAGPTTPPVRA